MFPNCVPVAGCEILRRYISGCRAAISPVALSRDLEFYASNHAAAMEENLCREADFFLVLGSAVFSIALAVTL
ncbi:hypothetical protein A2U01_0004762, partial [Trifolium medium]|nr:hypothetical protein [Trifolium medium]